MKYLFTLIFINIYLFTYSQENLRKITPEPIYKNTLSRLNTSDSILIDSFKLWVSEYKYLENKILSKIENDSNTRLMKSLLIDIYLCNYLRDYDYKLSLFIKILKEDFLLFNKNTILNGEPVSYNCSNNKYFYSLLANYIFNNKELNECNFFDHLSFYGDSWNNYADISSIERVKSEIKSNNIYLTAIIMKDYKLEFEKAVINEKANECYRKNAKLILEALEKNK